MRRVFVIYDGEKMTEFVNPEILERSGEQTPVEGCLSLPGVWGRVRRPAKVRIRAQDLRGDWFESEAEGLIAEAFDHENDHLDGLLFDAKIYEYVDMNARKEDEDDEEA